MLYLMLFFVVCFLFHFYRSNKFEKEHEDLFANEQKHKRNPVEADVVL